MDIDKIYELKFSNLGGVNQLGWGSTFSQNLRFEVLTQINGFCIDDSVLDVGCGYGDLSNLVRNYIGIDLREKAIEIAKSKYPLVKFKCCDIDQIDNKFDWIFASGIFCFKIDWESELKKTLPKLYHKCNKGVSVNFLSEFTKGNKDKDMKYCHPIELVTFVKELTDKFTIRHDYLHNDFTLYLYK